MAIGQNLPLAHGHGRAMALEALDGTHGAIQIPGEIGTMPAIAMGKSKTMTITTTGQVGTTMPTMTIAMTGQVGTTMSTMTIATTPGQVGTTMPTIAMGNSKTQTMTMTTTVTGSLTPPRPTTAGTMDGTAALRHKTVGVGDGMLGS